LKPATSNHSFFLRITRVNATALLYPVFVLIALTALLHGLMARARLNDLKTGSVKTADIILGQPGWSARTTQIGNSYHSQHELPVLFYVLVAFILITGKSDFFFVGLAWTFALLRIVHAYIHTTSNALNARFPAYGAGAAALLTMWIVFAFRIITGT
jgi:hypothetical protein